MTQPVVSPDRGSDWPAVLLVSEPGRVRLRIITSPTPLEIGRDCIGLNLTDPQISRRHIEVRSDAGGVMVTDLGSTNGSLLDGAALNGSHRLAVGEIVQIGATTIRIDTGLRVTNAAASGTATPERVTRATSIELVASAAAEDPPDFSALSADAGTLTFVFSDIEDSTRRAVELGDERWVALLEVHNTLIRRHVARHGGTEIKAQGDGFMLSFPSARAAVQCMIDIQRSLAAHARSRPADGLRIRIGAHTGEAIRDDTGDLFGRHVVIAARIANCAKGGEILVSSLLREIVASRGDLKFGPHRTVSLKGLDESHVVHPVEWHQSINDFASPNSKGENT